MVMLYYVRHTWAFKVAITYLCLYLSIFYQDPQLCKVELVAFSAENETERIFVFDSAVWEIAKSMYVIWRIFHYPPHSPMVPTKHIHDSFCTTKQLLLSFHKKYRINLVPSNPFYYHETVSIQKHLGWSRPWEFKEEQRETVNWRNFGLYII